MVDFGNKVLVTVRDAAGFLGLSQGTVYRQLATGESRR